jgi:hypothetical protein
MARSAGWLGLAGLVSAVLGTFIAVSACDASGTETLATRIGVAIGGFGAVLGLGLPVAVAREQRSIVIGLVAGAALAAAWMYACFWAYVLVQFACA